MTTMERIVMNSVTLYLIIIMNVESFSTGLVFTVILSIYKCRQRKEGLVQNSLVTPAVPVAQVHLQTRMVMMW